MVLKPQPDERLVKAGVKAILNAIFEGPLTANTVMATETPTRIATPRRRRSSLDEPLRKISVQITESLYEAMKSLVSAGEVASTNVFVEEAVRAQLRERRKSKIYAAYEQAARDPAFMRDMSADLDAFDATLADGRAPNS